MTNTVSTLHPCRAVAHVFVISAAVLAAWTSGAAEPVLAGFPNKPIRWIDPFAPGGGSDLLARAIGQKMTETWKQTVVLDNRGGASGIIGVDMVAKAPPDGYTIGNITATISVNPSVNKQLPYDLLRDLAPVIQLSSQPYMLAAHPGLGVNTVQQMIANAKSRPRQINYGSSGVGGLSHLAGALLGQLAGIEMTHVPYKGGAPALTDLLGGQIQILFVTVLTSQPHVKSGRLKWLAVSSAKRFRSLPDVQSIAESGVPGFDVSGWYGVVAPAKTPKSIVDQLNREMARILELPDIRERMVADGAEPVGSTPDAFWAHVGREVEKWHTVVTAAGIKHE
jgi:tripartite-type tricarboxylate transporter receptor subunit TctC